MHRVPECLSLRRNWVPTPPSPQASVLPPHSLAGEGVGGPNSDDWKESLASIAHVPGHLQIVDCCVGWGVVLFKIVLQLQLLGDFLLSVLKRR
jgi:hypothetical protein